MLKTIAIITAGLSQLFGGSTSKNAAAPRVAPEAEAARAAVIQAAVAQAGAERAAAAAGEVNAAFFADQELTKVTYLGVGTVSLDDALSTQLSLPPGVGLLVERVVPDSPAARAGVQRHDVLHKLGDQLLVNFQQLGTLVRMHKPGDKVTLTVIRKGTPTELTITLGEREESTVERRAMRFFPGEGLQWNDDGGRVLKLDELSRLEGLQDRLKELDVRIRENAPRIIRLGPGATSTIRTIDDKFDITITTRNGQRHVKALDKDGKVLFDGPYSREEEKQAAPAEIRERVEKMLSEIKDVVPPAPPAPADAPPLPPAGPQV